MSDDAESLLEIDQIETVLKAAESPQPVVVLQYPKRRSTGSLIVTLVAFLLIAGGLIYHRLEVDRLRKQALMATRELENWKERSRVEAERWESELAKAQLALVPSMPSVIPPPGSPETKPVGGSTSSEAGTRPMAMLASTEPRIPGREPSNAISGPPSMARVPGQAARTSGMEPRPVETESSGPFLGSSTVRSSASTQPSSMSTVPRAEFVGPLPASNQEPPRIDLAGEGVKPGPTVAAATEAPLPSKEETLRAIEEEAAEKDAEIRRQTTDNQVEIRRMRYEERVRFHQELREALELHGKRAGTAIDQLCQRYGYDSDPKSLARASRAWVLPGKPLAYRVGLIRSYNVPETVILNFLSDDLHVRLRTRNGPRNNNDVRVRATEWLLKCPVPPFDDADRTTVPIHGAGAAADRRIDREIPKAAIRTR